jgi:hypothetical protein
MSNLSELCDKFSYLAEKPIEVLAKKKDKNFVFPANSKLVNDGKSHFPLSNANQARAALSYSGHNDKHPWFNGSVESLRAAVRRAVKKHFPSINVSDKKSKKSFDETLEAYIIKIAGHYKKATGKNRTGYKKLDQLASDQRIIDIWDERDEFWDDGIWAELADGYRNAVDGSSCLHEWSVPDMLRSVKHIESGPVVVEGEDIKKEAATKERVDTEIDLLIRRLNILSTLSLMSTDTLKNLKNKFSVHFNPELEHALIEIIPQLNNEIYNYAKKTQNIHYRIQALLNDVD